MNMNRLGFPLFVLLVSGCASAPPDQPRIAGLADKPLALLPVDEAAVNSTTALDTYRDFLKVAPDGPTYREALRRSADVELESAQQAKPAPETAAPNHSGIEAAITLYREYLAKYPDADNNELVLYQLAKAYDLSGQMEDSLTALQRLLHQYPNGRYSEEALFRSGEMYFSMREHAAAEDSFKAIIRDYPKSLFYERSLYMLGWSLYLQNRFDESLQMFLTLLDNKLDENSLDDDTLSDKIPPSDRELLDDSLKVICLALSYQGANDPIATGFDRHGARPYEALIYRRLGEFYLDKQRYMDAAHTFMGMTLQHPDHRLAPSFHQYAIRAYERGGFVNLFFASKSEFVKNYGVDSSYWNTHDENIHQQVRPYLAADIKDLATHFHEIARRSRNPGDFTAAVLWYREYLRTFTAGGDAAEMNFMLAECLHDAGRYQEAVTEYEKTAYQYNRHKHSAESGYAALLTYKQIIPEIPDDDRDKWRQKAVASAILFSERFPQDRRVDRVLANAVDELFAMHDYTGTIDAAQRMLARPNKGMVPLRQGVLIVMGHARFETKEYEHAIKAYLTALNMLPADDHRRKDVIENLAASMYKQGEQRRQAGDLQGAIAIFMNIESAAPAPAIWTTAQYDAAAAMIELEDWSRAASVLEDFRRRKLGNPRLQHGVTEKLALVYMKTGKKAKAAGEMERLSTSNAVRAKRRELVWEAATLYQDTGAQADAIRLYKRYINEFPESFSESMEARHNLSVLYNRMGKTDEESLWLKEIIKADADAGSKRTDRSRQLAGEATLSLAQPLMQAYQRAKLGLPLKKSLKTKKALMEKAVAAYKKALEYRVADVSTAATYQLGNIYDQFAKAIQTSDRPRGLSNDELEQYNILLEDQSYSFQEKAIQLYEANIKHIGDGIYDDWTKRSLEALAALYPLRYAKTEQIEAYYDVSR